MYAITASLWPLHSQAQGRSVGRAGAHTQGRFAEWAGTCNVYLLCALHDVPSLTRQHRSVGIMNDRFLPCLNYLVLAAHS